MYNKKPPFKITTSILSKIAEVAELVGQVNAVVWMTTTAMLRRITESAPSIPPWLLNKIL